MLRIALALLIGICGFLGYEHVKLLSELEALKASKVTCDTKAPPPLQEAAPKTQSIDNDANLKKLVELREKLINRKSVLAALQKKKGDLEAKLKGDQSFNLEDIQRQIREKKEEIEKDRAAVKAEKQNKASVTQSPQYAAIKVRLTEIEKKIHEIKAGAKAAKKSGQPVDSNAQKDSQSDLLALKDQLKQAQQEQTAMLAKDENTSEEVTPSKQRIKTLKKEVARLEKAIAEHQDGEASQKIKLEIDKLDLEMNKIKVEIEELGRSIAELESPHA